MSPRAVYPEDDEDDENGVEPEQTGRRGRPSSYFSRSDPDNFGGSFRATRPVPHGGQATVSPDDTRGSIDLCWCGLPFDHDWPGKAGGSRHPRKEPTDMATPDTGTKPRIERRALRAYHADLQDVIIKAVNDFEVKYRITAHSVILFPPDGTAPYTINARNGDRQRKAAQQWFVKHCVPDDMPYPRPKERPVDEAAIKELAEAVSSEEHLPKAEEPQKARRARKQAPAAPEAPPTPEPEPEVKEKPKPQVIDEHGTPHDWVPYMVPKDKMPQKPHAFYLTDGVSVKCPEHDTILKPGGIGGHTRTHHTDTSTLWGPDAKAKGSETYRTNKTKARVEEAIAILQDAVGITPPEVDTEEVEKLKARITELEQELQGRLQSHADLEEQLIAANQKVTDMEAKAALAREALGL